MMRGSSRQSTTRRPTQRVMDVKAATLDPQTGMKCKDRKELAGRLSVALADTYTLYLKTQGFHWNVAGPMFYSLHKLTQEQYEDMYAAIDVIAERIRAIGHPAPASFGQFSALTEIAEERGVPTAEDMMKQLVEGNEICTRSLRIAVKEADDADDVKTADLLTNRIGQHEHNVWMLRALLAK